MEPSLNAEPAGTAVAITSTIERDSISPAQFMAEMEAAGLAGGKPAGEAAADPAVAAKAGETAVAKPAEGETPAVDVNGDKPDAPVEAKPEDKPADEKPVEAKADDSAEVKAARKIYAAAARKEAQALRLSQENKTLKGQLESLAKLRDEDPYRFLQEVGFGKGGEPDAIKDLLGRVVAKGEKAAPPTAEERIAALEAERVTERAEYTKRSEAQVLAAAKQGVVDAVKAAGDKYDLVNAFEDYEGVTDVMESYYEQHGVPCGVEAAAAAREAYHAAKLAKSTKFKAPAGAPAKADKPAPTSTGNKPASNAMGKSETLTNTESGSKELEDELPMEDHDARAKAVAKALGLAFIRN